MSFRANGLLTIKLLGLWTGTANGTIHRNQEDNVQNESSKSTCALGESEINSRTIKVSENLNQARDKSSYKITQSLLESGAPGLTISVSKAGETVWHTSYGYCDVENQLLCNPDAKMRIASISKSIFTATIVARMIEQKKIELNSSIHEFLTENEFPRKKYNNKLHDITVQQLLSHTSGIRSYRAAPPDAKTLQATVSKGSIKVYQDSYQYDRNEFHSRKTYRNVLETLEIFKDDDLVCEPGQYKYTTYGFTLLSAALQKVLEKDDETKDQQIEDYWVKVLHKDWGLKDTFLDHDERIISKRSRHYQRSRFNGGLVNAPFVDNSNKFAGGGLISNTSDLVKFGNLLIKIYKGEDNSKLTRETLHSFWTKVNKNYALGFSVERGSLDDTRNFVVGHTGGAAGGSSILLICPETEIVVAILTNLDGCNFTDLGLFIIDTFTNID